MAVGCQTFLIHERIREETRAGKSAFRRDERRLRRAYGDHFGLQCDHADRREACCFCLSNRAGQGFRSNHWE